MSNIFNMDNKFFTGLNKIVDVLWLNLIYICTCLFLITPGAATSALYYTLHKQIIHNRGYVWPTYWGAFKANFKNSTITWLIQVGASLLFAFDIYLTQQLINAGSTWGVLYYLFIIFVVLLWIWSTYCYCYFARFDQDRKSAWKLIAIISVANPGWSILTGLLLIAGILGTYILLPIGLFFLPIILFLIIYFIMEHVFKKYMAPEDIAKEQEEYSRDILD